MTQQLFNFDPTARKHGGDTESVAAFAASDRQAMEARALEFVRSKGDYGATADEFAESRSLAAHCVSGRFTTLKAKGLIVANGEKRITRNKSMAKVLVARD